MQSDNFIRCFEIVVGIEGGYTNNGGDPGNWTGGRVGYGILRGTKFGISAAAYPQLDIVSLELLEAQVIYRRDYWEPIRGDSLPIAIGLSLFDAAVNCGRSRAVKWLQQAVGTPADGLMGPVTLKNVAHAAEKPEGALGIVTDMQAFRLVFMAGLPTWRTFGLGWARRICRVCSLAQGTSTAASASR